MPRTNPQANPDELDLDLLLQTLQAVDPNGCWWYDGAPDTECGPITAAEALTELASMLE